MVAVATGRDMDSEFSKAYKKQLQPDAIVHSNGQKVTVGEKKDPGSLHGSEADRPHDGVLP